MPIKYFFALVILMAISCKSQKQNLNMAVNDTEITLLLEDAYFPVEERQAMAIADEKTLRAFFSKVNRTRKPGLPVPEIDFNKEVALIICAGKQKGNSTSYLEKRQETEELVSLSIVKKPVKERIDDELISYPFSIYKMPKTDKKINFIWE